MIFIFFILRDVIILIALYIYMGFSDLLKFDFLHNFLISIFISINIYIFFDYFIIIRIDCYSIG